MPGEITVTLPHRLDDAQRRQVEALLDQVIQRVTAIRQVTSRFAASFRDDGTPPIHLRIEVGGKGP